LVFASKTLAWAVEGELAKTKKEDQFKSSFSIIWAWPMKKPGDGSNGEPWDESGGGKPRKPGRALASFRLFPERALFVSTAIVICCWLTHFFFLLLVDPWRYLAVSRESAVAYASIPLGVAIVFLVVAVYNFIRIHSRSVFHIVLLIFALSFGSLSVQGIIGSASYLIRRSYGV
jgi:hypothetical protein